MCSSSVAASSANRFRSRFQAWFLDVNEKTMHRMYGAHKQRLLLDTGGTVVEVGPGVGANMRYYPRGQALTAVEPNHLMHGRLTHRAAAHGVALDIRQLRGERMDLPDDSADLVIATLLLCSVDDPAKVVAEIRRILKPGGRYVFIEHVAAEATGVLRLSQRVLRSPHKWVFEGCRTDRRTWETLGDAGFSRLDCRREQIMSPMFWIAPHILGEAVK